MIACVVDIVACPAHLTWGVSFDGGPSENSPLIFFLNIFFFCDVSNYYFVTSLLLLAQSVSFFFF